MKGVYLVAILSVATLTVVALDGSLLENEIPTKCPAVDPKNRTISLPHETDCTKFYTCLAGRKTEQSCPFMDKNGNRLHFNPVLQICDWPQQAGCAATARTSRSTSTTTSKTFSTTQPVYCPEDTKGITIRLTDESLCDHFYLCTDGKVNLVRCPRGFSFNTILRICDFPENVDCDQRRTTVETDPTVPTIPRKNRNTCPPKGSHLKALLPHEYQCNSYYECLDGDPVLKQCSKGLHYDDVQQVCDLPHRVKCVSSTPGATSPIVRPVYEVAESSLKRIKPQTLYRTAKCIEKPDGTRLPHEYKCSLYYKCINGRKFLLECRRGMRFNRNRLVCDFPRNVRCEDGLPIDPTELPIPTETIVPTEPHTSTEIILPTESTEKSTSDTETVIPTESTEKSTSDTETVIPTESTEKSTSDTETVIPTESTEESTSNTETVIPIEPTEKPIPEPPLKCRPDEIYRYPHEIDCNLYYLCSYGEKTLYRCPRNLRFNRDLSICDQPENVPCDHSDFDDDDSAETEKGRIKSPASCIGTCPSQDPFNYTILLPNDDCTKFCMCSHGVAYLHQCPADLRFDYIKKICDNPGSAVCGVRSSSQNPFTIDSKNKNNEEDSAEKSSEEIDRTRDNYWFRLFSLGGYI